MNAHIQFAGSTNDYYQLWEASTLTSETWSIRGMALGEEGTQAVCVSDALTQASQAFYRLGVLSLNRPGDADGDSMDDVYELTSPVLNPLDDADAGLDSDGDALINIKEYEFRTLAEQIDSDHDGVDDGWEYYSGGVTNCNLPTSGVNRLWLYHGNTAFADPLTEPVPGLPMTFLTIDPVGGTNTLHFLAPQHLTLGGHETPVLEFHYAVQNPDTWAIEADAWIHDVELWTSVVVDASAPFHGLPTLGCATLDVYRVQFPHATSVSAGYIWYVLLVKSMNENYQQTDYTYLLDVISGDWGQPGYGANNWRVGPQLYGAEYYSRDYLVTYDTVGLRNGDFEDGATPTLEDLEDWEQVIPGSDCLGVSTSVVVSGDRSVVLTNWAGGLWQGFGVLAGQEFVFEGRMMTPEGEGRLTGTRAGFVSLEFYDRHGALLGMERAEITATSTPAYWTAFSITSVVPDRARSCNVSLSQDGLGSGTVYFDALSLQTAVDSDGDGIPDYLETAIGLDPDNKMDGFGDADGDGLLNAQEYRKGSDWLSQDTDEDGLSDAWEVAHGYDPSAPSESGSDADGDGLSDIEERQLGSDPFHHDSDGDGVPDRMEVCVFGSDPARPDFDSFETFLAVPAYEAEAFLGDWIEFDGDMIALDRRGRIDFTVNIETAGIYRLEVEAFDEARNLAVAEFDLQVYVDGKFIRRIAIETENGHSSAAGCFLPYLPAGPHQLSLYWDNGSDAIRLRLRELRLQAIAGEDSDDDGRKDWEENWLECLCSVEWPTGPIHTSPVCLEGQGRHPETMTVSGGALAEHGAGDRWFADVPLSPLVGTPVAVSFQSGGLVISNDLTWTPLNMLLSEDLRIRRGDSLMMTAHPEGVTQGVFSITLSGVTNYTSSVDTPVAHLFEEAGTYAVQVLHDHGVVTSNERAITVMDADFGEEPIVWKDRNREWLCTNLEAEAVIEADPRLQLEEQPSPPEGGRLFRLTTDANESRYVVARLGADGPIIDSVECKGVEVLSSGDTYLRFVETLPDGTHLVEMLVVESPVREGLTIKIEIYVGGITFEDGSLVKTLTAADFNELGECPVRFIYPEWALTSVCHDLSALQGETKVGVP